MSGVTRRAGASVQDWQVRDRKMNIFAKDLPLLSLMNSMARVMRFTWSKNAKVDPPIYRFYTDRRKISEMTAEQRAWLGGKVSCFPTTTARRPTTGARAKWLHGEVRLWKKLSAIS
ncbi:MAG: hypothetical protein Q7N50_05065 [Armatimonadota bacterium]|nr:hypothetical protein [Armatimonadota bacterium]